MGDRREGPIGQNPVMCGRSQFLPVPQIEVCFAPVRRGDVAGVSEEAFPGSTVPGIVLHRDERVVSSFRWGFFDGGPSGTGHNARLESASSRPAWRDAYAGARLVLPVAAFVEGRAWFRPPSGPGLALAGLFRLGPGGRRATMLTRPADPTVAPFHGRMPVILPADLVEGWLARADVPVGRLLTTATDLVVEPLRSAPQTVEPTVEQPSLLDDGEGPIGSRPPIRP